MPRPSAQIIKEFFDYDPISGALRWKFRDYVRPSWNTKYAGNVVGSLCRNGYLKLGLKGKNYLVHVIIWAWMTGEWPSVDIDHKDTNRSNNSWSNLRLATRSQNMANMRNSGRNTSGYKGVFFKKQTGRYRASIVFQRKEIHLGYFDTPEEAHAVYKIKQRQLFGEFARAI